MEVCVAHVDNESQMSQQEVLLRLEPKSAGSLSSSDTRYKEERVGSHYSLPTTASLLFKTEQRYKNTPKTIEAGGRELPLCYSYVTELHVKRVLF